jgi:hypothetical protein
MIVCAECITNQGVKKIMDHESEQIGNEHAAREMMHIAEAVQEDADAERDYLDTLAEARYSEQNGSPDGYAQDL